MKTPVGLFDFRSVLLTGFFFALSISTSPLFAKSLRAKKAVAVAPAQHRTASKAIGDSEVEAGRDAASVGAEEVSGTPDSVIDDNQNAAAPDTSAFGKALASILARNYAGTDTSALLSKIQEKLKWSQQDEKLVEAEGILHYDRGEFLLALPCFQRLSDPGALTAGLMADCLMRKGDRYEAAPWYLKSARGLSAAPRPDKSTALEQFQNYLRIKPDDGAVELEMAAVLEQQQRYPQAAEIYLRHQAEALSDTVAVFKIGALLTGNGRDQDALDFYAKAREAHPDNKTLCVRMAALDEKFSKHADAAQLWSRAWDLDAADSLMRNRAIAAYEADGAPSDANLKNLLTDALRRDSLSGSLNFKMAQAYLRENDRESAYQHLDRAIKSAPGYPEYAALLPEVIEGDSLIRVHFNFLKTKFEKEGGSLRLILLAARGYSLAGDKLKSCQAWSQAQALSHGALDGRRDAFLDLAACPDPAYLTMAAGFGEKLIADRSDLEVIGFLLKASLQDRNYPKATVFAKRMIDDFPAEAATVFAAGKAIQVAGHENEARQVFAEVSEKAPALVFNLRSRIDAVKKSNNKKELGEAYRDVARLDTADEEANAFLAGLAQAARDYKEASLCFHRVAVLHPNDGKAWENYGNALAMIPDLDAAGEALQKALDLGIESDETYINRARAYRKEGAKDMAASIMAFLLDRNPTNYLATLWLGKFAEEDGNTQLALEYFKKAAKLTPPKTAWPELAAQGMREAGANIP